MLLRNPRRELEMPGPVRVSKLLETLGINPETVLVIRNETLVTHDERLEEPDTVEIRPDPLPVTGPSSPARGRPSRSPTAPPG